MTRWPDNSVWEEKEVFNRAPRPTIIECKRSRRCWRWRVARGIVKAVIVGGLFWVIMLGAFYLAR
jgi:hypothetical protein